MKAVVLKEIGVIEVQDVPEPEPEPDQIKVKIAYAGICGSDPKIIAGLNKPAHREGAIGGPLKTTPPRPGIRIIGHEASGTIVKIGKAVKGNFKIGQKVAMDFRSTCGSCYYCSNKMAHFCERVSNFSGMMAEYAVFPQGIVFPLPYFQLTMDTVKLGLASEEPIIVQGRLRTRSWTASARPPPTSGTRCWPPR